MALPIESLVPDGVFESEWHYFDTPTYGLAPTASYEAVVRAAERWRTGIATMTEYDEAVARSRNLFGRIVGVDPAAIAIGANVSSLVGPLVTGLPPGSTVVVPEGEFTSLLFPLLVNRALNVRTVPFADLVDAVDESVDVLAFSLVQSSSGEIADLEGIARTVRDRRVITLVDATHAAGWLPFDATNFDFVFVAAYKWLLCPRGVAFMTMNTEFMPPPTNAGWYSGEDPWASIYGEPLRLAESARRFDTSPAWISWVGAVPSLELIDALGVDRIHAHDVALATEVRRRLDVEESASAIVTLSVSQPERLEEKGVKAAVRGSAVRLGCHIHNSSEDIEALFRALNDYSET